MRFAGPCGDQERQPKLLSTPFREHQNDGRDAADGASTGTEFQSRLADGKKECRCVSVLDWGI